ncbi:MAG: hypothetical protein G4V63_32495 [Candidatus Afipia apatlaquensis]|jgi:ATP-dependent RNA helicase HelY|uniref:Uncharacterized protein n=1 Tax=Candidatus Afipia apatlaquensis TaxID=2712852 RepID=A0A7C9VTS5_9BRAD|nr:hypothetical protein [Afipia sp.]NGX99734.1 hypothetical protein [Candidatus Afipia apatlaquensis]OUX60620.1 MAG: hypothetical protein CBB64_13450 [Afipia sp. TMED4]HAQ93698.1 hypothetical protein [Afipia sp.]|tara:strand:+ start:237 stop:746 length:510 start_codon:yes stop_codon:yes gene_type:complete
MKVQWQVSGTKQGSPPTNAEFDRLANALLFWLGGRPYREIELELGTDSAKLECCWRARDLVLKLANRRLYLILSAIGGTASQLYISRGVSPPQPSVLETLAVAIRKGFDTPQKVAYDQVSKIKRPRIGVHINFAQDVPKPPELEGQSYEIVRDRVETRLMFAAITNVIE